MFRSPTIFKKVFPERIWGISVSDKSVFLTFDDGPIPQITPWILDFLKEQKIVATFFCVGENVIRNRAIYERIQKEGHQVGNHTMKHLNGMKVQPITYLRSVAQAKQTIDSSLFRPPYGRISKPMSQLLSKRFKIVMWSWLSKDYDKEVSPDSIIEASHQIKPGDILVFHDNIKTMDRLQKILPPIIERLKAENYIFRTID